LRLKPERLATVARSALALCRSGRPGTLPTLFGRHSLLGRLWRLCRDDVRRHTRRGAVVYRGMPPPRRLLAGLLPDETLRTELLPELCGLGDGLGAEIVQALLKSSPLTDLLEPARGELLFTLPLDLLKPARWLQEPKVARLLSRRYLELGLPKVGPVLGAGLIALLAHARAARAPISAELSTWLCLVSHLHLCVHVVAETVLPPPGAPPPLLDFYALFAALFVHRPELAMPPDVLSDALLRPQVERHVERCRALAGPTRIKRLAELLGEPHEPAA
jgi:hypothetical protein